MTGDRTWSYKEMIEDIDEVADEILSDWEKDFMRSISDRVDSFKDLTERQEGVLRRIYLKTAEIRNLAKQQKMARESWEVAEKVLDEWSCNFLDSIKHRLEVEKRPLTDKQLTQLERVYAEVCRSEY